MREIDDEGLAVKIRNKVNDFNVKSNVLVAILIAAYCAIPLGGAR